MIDTPIAIAKKKIIKDYMSQMTHLVDGARSKGTPSANGNTRRPLARVGELGGKSTGLRLLGLDSVCRQVMHGRSGLCLGGMAHMRPVCHCDGARCCGRLAGDM